jgi:hypothetical protein
MHEPQGSVPARPTPDEIAAMIGLLGDDHEPIAAAARERLLHWGELAAGALRQGAEALSMRLRARCRSVLRAIEVQRDLLRLCSLRLGRTPRSAPSPLLEGAVALSSLVRTFVPPADELAALLRREAALLRPALGGRSLPTCARLLAERLHDQFGLRGGEHAPGGIDAVAIDRVLALRRGAPVTLSLIYVLVARWAGLAVTGVSMPDYFLVRLHGTRPILLDPFHAGRSITKADCARYLRACGHGPVRDHLRDLGDRELLRHYLAALQRAVADSPVADARTALLRANAVLGAE